MFKSLEESMKTKKAEILAVENYEHAGERREQIKAKKANGKKTYMVIKYSNGLYSSAVCH